MKRERFLELRSNVLDKFNNLETLMNLLISNYYFGEPNKDFIFRVLHNPYFSSVLRIDLTTKIIKDTNKKRFNKVIGKLKEMSNIRNYFAHITPIYFNNKEPTSSEVGSFPHPKNPSQEIDFEKEHESFFELEKEVHSYLVNSCLALGIKFPVKF